MVYNKKYDVYVDTDLIFYKWSNTSNKLIQKSVFKGGNGYYQINTKLGKSYVHKVVYETFVGEIPDGMEIDHINTIKTDNRIENLRCVKHKVNMNNSATKNNMIRTYFGRKFYEHYGINQNQNINLYKYEYTYYHRHNKFSWENN